MYLTNAFVRDLPNRVQMYDYGERTDGQPVYWGHAEYGTATDSGGWIIFKYAYNEDSTIAKIESRGGIWDAKTEYFS